MSTALFDRELAAKIDHTLLKPDAGERQVLRICDEARRYGFASVCVNPAWVRLSANVLKDSGSRVCTVIGFPLGSNRTEIKIRETELAAADGAEEFDMVLHIGRLKQGDFAYVAHDIQAVVAAANASRDSALVKVILETCLLERAEIVEACRIALDAGADFVKTSTGFSSGGAETDIVRLMRATVGETIGVKASGGIRNRESALSMIEAGANRIGASASIEIVRQQSV
jgi:deoxyribose-phosphate aldolase